MLMLGRRAQSSDVNSEL